MANRFEATSVAGFIQQLAVAYLTHGYWFYVTGAIPERKDPWRIDAKLLERHAGNGPSRAIGEPSSHRTSCPWTPASRATCTIGRSSTVVFKWRSLPDSGRSQNQPILNRGWTLKLWVMPSCGQL